MAVDPFFDRESLLWEEEGLFSRDVDGQLIRLEKATQEDYDEDITVTIDGRQITVKKAVPTTDSQGNIINDRDGRTIPRRTTIYDAATQLVLKDLPDIVDRHGLTVRGSIGVGVDSGVWDVNPIPILCHQEHMNPAGFCRVCSVEVCRLKDGKQIPGGKLVPACQHPVDRDMVVHTVRSRDVEASKRVRRAVKVVLELLSADHLASGRHETSGEASGVVSNELAALAKRLGADTSRFSSNENDWGRDVELPPDRGRPRDDSSVFIAVDHSSCILCERCIRACNDVKQNFVIGRSGKGYTAKIGFDFNEPMGQSSCIECGECMVSCPTDALTFRKEVDKSSWWTEVTAQPNYYPVGADELKRHRLFRQVSYTFLQWNAASVVRRVVQPGDVLCWQGDYGSTAFVLNDGKFDVRGAVPRTGSSTPPKRSLGGVLGRLLNQFGQKSKTTTVQRRPDRVNMEKLDELGEKLAEVTREDVILGEMVCMSHYPRTATVVALEKGEVYEIRRNMLYALQRNPVARTILEKVYRERALDEQLRRNRLFSGLSDVERQECVDFLRSRVELVRVDPGQTIFRQGEPADDFFLLRLGFVKVSRVSRGEERVLNYVSPGNFLGEIGLLSLVLDDIAELVADVVAPGTRTSACSALDDVELVRIRGVDFRHLVSKYEALRQRLVEHVKELLARDRELRYSTDQPIAAFLDQGLYNAQALLVLDLDRCTRCDECARACADTHGGVTRLIREGLRFDKYLVASACRSCLDPYCLVGCPVDAIHRDHSLEVVIDKHCIGCGLCAKNCPYGNINMHELATKSGTSAVIAVTQYKATTCDLCADIVGPAVRGGRKREVSCVYACPHNAAFRMSGEELQQRIIEEKEANPRSPW